MERNHIYELYLFCEPYLILLDNESIIDANILKDDVNKKESKLIIETNDEFFFLNLDYIEEKDFFIVLQTFETDGHFSHQFEFFGEDFYLEDNKVIFNFQTISTNHISPSISPYWENAIISYKSKRVSYIRNSKIESLLS